MPPPATAKPWKSLSHTRGCPEFHEGLYEDDGRRDDRIEEAIEWRTEISALSEKEIPRLLAVTVEA